MAINGSVEFDVGHYIGLVAEAAVELAEKGCLFNEGVPAIVRHAARHWHRRTSPAQP